MKLAGGFAALIAVTMLGSLPVKATTFGSYGDTTVTASGFDLVSDPAATGYAGIYIKYSAGGPTLASITQLSSDYNMLGGAFANGAPRFTLFDTNFDLAYVYWGTPLGGGSFTNPNPNNTPGNTGNYADLSSTDLRVYSNGFGGVNSPNTGKTWAQFVAEAGSTTLTYAFLDLDGGYTEDTAQHLLVNNFTVNGDVDAVAPAATPLPAALPMLASGLGVFGFVAARRKRRKANITA